MLHGSRSPNFMALVDVVRTFRAGARCRPGDVMLLPPTARWAHAALPAAARSAGRCSGAAPLRASTQIQTPPPLLRAHTAVHASSRDAVGGMAVGDGALVELDRAVVGDATAALSAVIGRVPAQCGTQRRQRARALVMLIEPDACRAGAPPPSSAREAAGNIYHRGIGPTGSIFLTIALVLNPLQRS